MTVNVTFCEVPKQKHYPDSQVASDLTTTFTLDTGLHDYMTNIKASVEKGPLVFTYSKYHKWLSDESVIR